MQQRDSILIDGEEQTLQSLPLDDFIPFLSPYIKFTPPSTACWHGYTAGWALEDKILYLVDFIGYVGPWGESVSVDLDYLFPSSNKIKAWWFTGILRIPQGEPVGCYPTSVGYVYEEYLYIQIESGIETGRYVEREELKIDEDDDEIILYKRT